MPFVFTNPVVISVPVATNVSFTQARVRRFVVSTSPIQINVTWAIGKIVAGNFEEGESHNDTISGADATAILGALGNPALTQAKQLEQGVFNWLVAQNKIAAGTYS